MSMFFAVIAVSLLASSQAAVSRARRETSKDDLKPAETRILPFGPYEHSLADPYLGGIQQGIVGAYGPAVHGLQHSPIGLVHGYNNGYLNSGINDGSLAIGNHGGEIYNGGSDGRYADGSFHENGVVRDGGYQGVEGYKDNKHHVADDFANRGFYNGVQGIRKDLGNGQVFDKSQQHAQNGYNSLGDSELAGHKKGHHRTGFKKSYHKDESGNDESFYDSDHDEGNHALGQNYDDRYGSQVGSHLNGGHKLNEFEASQQGNNGYEGSGKLLALNQGVKDYYGKNGFYNSGNKYGSLGGGQSQNYGKYGLQNGYHNGFNNGRSFQDFRGGKFGAGIGGYGPYGY